MHFTGSALLATLWAPSTCAHRYYSTIIFNIKTKQVSWIHFQYCFASIKKLKKEFGILNTPLRTCPMYFEDSQPTDSEWRYILLSTYIKNRIYQENRMTYFELKFRNNENFLSHHDNTVLKSSLMLSLAWLAGESLSGPWRHMTCVVWCGVVWCGVVWCGVVWCGVVWCGVVWCDVMWCDVM